MASKKAISGRRIKTPASLPTEEESTLFDDEEGTINSGGDLGADRSPGDDETDAPMKTVTVNGLQDDDEPPLNFIRRADPSKYPDEDKVTFIDFLDSKKGEQEAIKAEVEAVKKYYGVTAQTIGGWRRTIKQQDRDAASLSALQLALDSLPDDNPARAQIQAQIQELTKDS